MPGMSVKIELGDSGEYVEVGVYGKQVELVVMGPDTVGRSVRLDQVQAARLRKVLMLAYEMAEVAAEVEVS